MTFAHPLLLGALLLLLPAVWLWRRSGRQAARLRGTAWESGRRQTGNGRAPRAFLTLLELALAVVALAGPRWGSEITTVETGGLQLMVLLDVSQSMLAADAHGSRLAQAQAVAHAAAGLLTEEDAAGLMLFAGETRLPLPLTIARSRLEPALAAAHPALLARQGTALGAALQTAVRAFPSPHSGQPVILLLSDGEDHGSALLSAAETAVNAGVIVLAVGVGTADGAPVPQLDEQGQIAGHKLDAAGAPVITRLNDASLRQIAGMTNGRYLPAAAAAVALPAILEEIRVAHGGQTQIVRPVERFHFFLLPAVLLLALAARPWPDWRPRLTARRALLLLIIVLAGCRLNEPARWIEQGNAAFADAAYLQAQQAYETAVQQEGETAVARFNLANTFYRQELYEQAAANLQTVVDKSDTPVLADALFNQGNALFQQEQYAQAAAAYQAALRLDPQARDAKHNLELALRRLAAAQPDGGGEEPHSEEEGGDGAEEEVERPSLPTADGDMNYNPDAGTAAEAPIEIDDSGPDFPLTPQEAAELLTLALESAAVPLPLSGPAPEIETTDSPAKDW